MSSVSAERLGRGSSRSDFNKYGALNRCEDIEDDSRMIQAEDEDDYTNTIGGSCGCSGGLLVDLDGSADKDAYNPSFDSPLRLSTERVAISNLLSTIVGGGTLSLPFAFKNCGIIPAFVIVIISIYISTTILRLLCVLSRKLNTNKYSEIMDKSIVQGMGDVTDLVLIIFLLLVVTAFMVLLKDISGNIIDFSTSSTTRGDEYKSSVLVVIVILMFPLMFSENLYALRHVSFLGIFSVVFLLAVIMGKTAQSFSLYGDSIFRKVDYWPENYNNVLTSLPIILIAFMCQFNILGVHANLIRPSYDRMNYVINCSIGGSGVLYVLFGLCGYLVAFDETKDNILNNFEANDRSLIIARAGLCLTLMCQIPMVLVPCRDSIFLLINKYFNLQGDSMLTRIIKSTKFMSIFIACTGLFLAERVPGVSVIWSIAGSSISMILAFLFPSIAYICLWRRAKSPLTIDAGMAIFIFFLSITMIYLCTTESINKLYAPGVPQI